MLPGESGVTLTRRLRAEERTRELPILMLTARAMEHDKVSGLDAGADELSHQAVLAEGARARIKAVLRRRAPQLADDVVEMAGLRLDPAGRRVTANGAVVELAPTEFGLLPSS